MKILKCLCILSVLFVSCTPIIEVRVLEDVEEFQPPSVYYTWYGEVQERAGFNRSFSITNWYKTSMLQGRVESENEHFHSWNGVWIEPGDIILDADCLYEEDTVKHEMKHYLLQKWDHDDPLFDSDRGNCL